MPIPYQVAYKPLNKPEVGDNGYVEPTPGKSEVIPKGSAPFGGRTLDSDVRIDHDVELVVRDGCRLYADIYRPATDDEKIPVIISWSPYGKKYSAVDMIFNICVWACCLKKEDVSGLEEFEGVSRDDFALHLELFTIRRTSGKLKFLAGSESGMSVFINDVPPETAAQRLREVASK
jgi:hypothetical protein